MVALRARLLMWLRALLRRRRKAEPVTRGVWADFSSLRLRPPATKEWFAVNETWKIRAMTADEWREHDLRPPRPRRQRWLDRPGG